jgi:outer membrane lipoprotein SlyB
MAFAGKNSAGRMAGALISGLKTAPSGADNGVNLTAANTDISQGLIGKSAQLGLGLQKLAMLEKSRDKLVNLVRDPEVNTRNGFGTRVDNACCICHVESPGYVYLLWMKRGCS